MWMMFWFGAFIMFLGSTVMARGDDSIPALIIMGAGVLFTIPAFVGMIRRAWKDEE